MIFSLVIDTYMILCMHCSHTIANHLFSRLGDEELMNRVEASSLFAKLGN